MQIKSSLILIITIFVFQGCNISKNNQALVPLEYFFKNPEKTYIKISPNGRYISYTAPWKNRMNLFIQEVKSDSVEQITFEPDRGIGGYIWANDTRLLYVKDEDGNEDFKLYAVNIDGSDLKCLTCFEGVRITLIDELIDSPNEIIVGLNMRDPTLFDPYRIDIVTGKMKMIAENPGNVINWITDHNGQLRLAIAIVGGVNQTILYRDNESDPFKPVLKNTWKNKFIPQFFTFDNKMIYALSNVGRDKMEVVVFDPKSKTETEVLYKNKDVDVSKLNYSRKRKTLTSVSYTSSKKQEHFFDKQTEKHYKLIKSKLKGVEISVASRDRSEENFIIKSYSDKSKGIYFLYNTEFQTLTEIAEVNPWLKKEQMASMKAISYTSRDGLTINGYLTLPNGTSTKDLPVVVLPHGGPWARDYWGFNPEVQFLANRGYAVFQMNYRGSTGYGKSFWLKSVKEWGGNMQNDITDGVNWLINEGIADKDKIAIYGTSWGGFAALYGVTFQSEIYACGIDYVGPSNMFTFMKSLPPYWEPMRQMFYEMAGDPIKDSVLFAAISPALHVDKIKVPMLIAQGANDPRVNVSESDQIANELSARGIYVDYIVKENEGHGFKNEENRIELYEAIEIFLDKYLKNIN